MLAIKNQTHWGKIAGISLILMHFPDVCLFLSKYKGTYPACSLGALVIVLRGILCLPDINWRKWFTLMSSRPLEMKALRNFLILREFLVACFLRFMNLSNIMDLSSPPVSLRLDPVNRLLSNETTTHDASGGWKALPQGIVWFRADHSFSKILFGAWVEEDAARWWVKVESNLRVLGGFGRLGDPGWCHFWCFECHFPFCLCFWGFLLCSWYLGNDCSFSKKVED